MDFKDSYPDYVAIEEHIRRARIERSLALSQLIADAVAGSWRGLRQLAQALSGVRATRSPKPAISPR